MPKIFESPDKGKTFTEREFTVEGTPFITEPNVEEFNMKIYEQARRDRLSDVIGDYITDENTNAETFHSELISEIDGWLKYHEKFMDKCQTIKNLLSSDAV